ncbi:15810_t:CDS:1, partial [Cetraspora pellucida]
LSIGCNHLVLALKFESKFVDAGWYLKDSSKNLADRFLTLCSVLF